MVDLTKNFLFRSCNLQIIVKELLISYQNGRGVVKIISRILSRVLKSTELSTHAGELKSRQNIEVWEHQVP